MHAAPGAWNGLGFRKMWALELWHCDPAAPNVAGIDPIFSCGGDAEVACYHDGTVLVRRRGDCAHLLYVRRAGLETNERGDRLLLYCILCERPIELHVSEVPAELIPEIHSLLRGRVHWCRRSN